VRLFSFTSVARRIRCTDGKDEQSTYVYMYVYMHVSLSLSLYIYINTYISISGSPGVIFFVTSVARRVWKPTGEEWGRDWPLQDIRLYIPVLCTRQCYHWHETPPLFHPPVFRPPTISRNVWPPLDSPLVCQATCNISNGNTV